MDRHARAVSPQLIRMLLRRLLPVACMGIAALALAACSSEEPAATATPSAAAAGSPAATGTATATASAAAATATPASLPPLKASPERGPGGTQFTITGEGLKPSSRLQLLWVAVDGTYKTQINNNRVEYYDRVFTQPRVPLGEATTDAQGKLSATVTAPQDFGGVHDIYAVLDGKDVAKSGFALAKTVTFSPSEGPIGTMITVRITGIGYTAFTSTGAIRYDNKYVGYVSATTTKGTVEAKFRAAGPVGDHTIELYGASHTLPYLNIEQSPVAAVGTYRAGFRVTRDDGPPANVLEWSDPARVNADPAVRTTITVGNVAGSSAIKPSVSPAAGTVGSTPTVKASGLQAGSSVDLVWITVTGNDLFGWNLGEQAVGKGTVAADGTLSASMTIPESLGGWHAVRLASGGKTLGEVPYFVERSLLGITPQKVKAGEQFTVHFKGVGWTEIDNGFAVTYDNSYVGYACGFASTGDVTITLVATGGPGTHLVDLYPMIYDGGHGAWPWQYNFPMLTFAKDHPGLALGYRLPAARLAIEVVP